VSFLRPLGPQADSPGRLTELTVSTAGWLAGCWLAGWLAGWLALPAQRSHPASHLPLLPRVGVCHQSAGVYLALPASL